MDEVINYVMETPGNTNPNVLRGMLENNGQGGVFNVTDTEGTLDKTYAEIEAAYLSGASIIVTRQIDEKGISIIKNLVVGIVDDSDTGALTPY